MRTTGRISSLLELGAGFHPDLTGRENVFLNGSILGLRRRDIAQRLDAIVAFSDLERFIDHPVKHYSSGMFVRLAFSVAMEVDPEILILDEVLSVGDERFREKCRVRIGEFRRRGKTFLIVSHDMDTIQTICDRVLVLDRGKTVLEDVPARAVSEYHAINALGEGPSEGPEVREWGTREAVILGVDAAQRARRAGHHPRRPGGVHRRGPLAGHPAHRGPGLRFCALRRRGAAAVRHEHGDRRVRASPRSRARGRSSSRSNRSPSSAAATT